MDLLRAIIRHPLTDVVLYAVIIDNSPAIRRVLVGLGARSDIAAAGDHATATAPALRSAAALVRSYLCGDQVDFSEMLLAPDNETLFASAVRTAACSVPYGQTCSYSGLAHRAGYPAAVRAAASVMRRNPFPLLVPCHRIVRKNGTTGAYNGDFIGTDAALKNALLRMERTATEQRSIH